MTSLGQTDPEPGMVFLGWPWPHLSFWIPAQSPFSKSRFFLEAWLFGDPGVELAIEGRLPERSVSDSSLGFPDSTLQADITSWPCPRDPLLWPRLRVFVHTDKSVFWTQKTGKSHCSASFSWMGLVMWPWGG